MEFKWDSIPIFGFSTGITTVVQASSVSLVLESLLFLRGNTALDAITTSQKASDSALICEIIFLAQTF